MESKPSLTRPLGREPEGRLVQGYITDNIERIMACFIIIHPYLLTGQYLLVANEVNLRADGPSRRSIFLGKKVEGRQPAYQDGVG